MSVKTRRTTLILALLLLTLSLATCISAEERDYMTYDAATDEFRMLMVLRDIRVKDADDLAYLKGIFNNRDHLIAPALPGGSNLIAMLPMSLLRVSGTQFALLNIYGSRPDEIAPTTTAVPLASVKITPGAFFLQDKKLGYYQAITVPGKTIDAALLEISQASQTDDMAKAIQAEMDRRDAGGKTATWARLTDETVKQIEIKPDNPDGPVAINMVGEAPLQGETPATATAPATAPAEDIRPLMVLELDSLKALRQAVADKTLRLTRDKQNITLALPLTARDAAGLVDLDKAVLARIDEVIKNTKDTPEVATNLQQARAGQQLVHALTVTAAGKGVTASLDLLTMAKSIAALPAQRIDMNSKDDQAKAGPDAVQYLRDQNIPLDESLTAEQIVKDFTAGTLKGYPSDQPVKPGEGIVPAPMP